MKPRDQLQSSLDSLCSETCTVAEYTTLQLRLALVDARLQTMRLFLSLLQVNNYVAHVLSRPIMFTVTARRRALFSRPWGSKMFHVWGLPTVEIVGDVGMTTAVCRPTGHGFTSSVIVVCVRSPPPTPPRSCAVIGKCRRLSVVMHIAQHSFRASATIHHGRLVDHDHWDRRTGTTDVPRTIALLSLPRSLVKVTVSL